VQHSVFLVLFSCTSIFLAVASQLSGLLEIRVLRKKQKLHGLSPQANYTDRQSDRSLLVKLVPNLRIEGATWSA
jgi:hypothetical protein